MHEDQLIERLLDNRKKRLRWEREVDSERRDKSKLWRKRGKLGLSPGELRALELHARFLFLGRPGTQDFWRPHWRCPHAWTVKAEDSGVWWGLACEGAIADACGDFADMLCQATMARHRGGLTEELVDELLSESIRFALKIAEWDSALIWIDRVWSDQSYCGQSDDQAPMLNSPKSLAVFQKDFLERMRIGRSGWLSEADRRIGIRQVLAGPGRRSGPVRSGPKLTVLGYLLQQPKLLNKGICERLDKKSVPLPASWIKAAPGCTGWTQAHCDSRIKKRVTVFFSLIRQAAKSM